MLNANYTIVMLLLTLRETALQFPKPKTKGRQIIFTTAPGDQRSGPLVVITLASCIPASSHGSWTGNVN